MSDKSNKSHRPQKVSEAGDLLFGKKGRKDEKEEANCKLRCASVTRELIEAKEREKLIKVMNARAAKSGKTVHSTSK